MRILRQSFRGGVYEKFSEHFEKVTRKRQSSSSFLVENLLPITPRGSRSQMFFKIGVLKNFANFTGKNLCWSLFLIKGHLHRCFSVKFLKFLRTTFLQNTASVATLSRVILRRAFHMHFQKEPPGVF